MTTIHDAYSCFIETTVKDCVRATSINQLAESLGTLITTDHLEVSIRHPWNTVTYTQWSCHQGLHDGSSLPAQVHPEVLRAWMTAEVRKTYKHMVFKEEQNTQTTPVINWRRLSMVNLKIVHYHE